MADSNPPIVISGDRAKVSDNGRRFSVAYVCPRCRADLESRDADVLGVDRCPNCGTTFVFDDAIQRKYAARVAAMQRAEEEARKLREEAAAKREEERAEREREEQERRHREARQDLQERERYAEAQRRAVRQRVENLSDVDEAVALVLIILGCVAAIGAVAGMLMLSADDSSLRPSGVTLLASVASLGVMMPLIAKLFRCLIAIHALLLRIAHATEKAESSSEE